MDTLFDPDEKNENYVLSSPSNPGDVPHYHHSASSPPRSFSSPSVDDILGSPRLIRANSGSLQSPPPIRGSELDRSPDSLPEPVRSSHPSGRPATMDTEERTATASPRNTRVRHIRLSDRSKQLLLHVGGHLDLRLSHQDHDQAIDDALALDTGTAIEGVETALEMGKETKQSIPSKAKGKIATGGNSTQWDPVFPNMERSDHRKAVEAISDAKKLVPVDAEKVAENCLADSSQVTPAEGVSIPSNPTSGFQLEKLTTQDSAQSDESDVDPDPQSSEGPQRRTEGGGRRNRRH